jgi:SPP1 gp7 family putative phage head morphogenesis protein
VADTANERIRDALIRHQIGLQGLGASFTAELIRILDKTEGELRDEVQTALAAGASIDSRRGLRRLQNLEDKIDLIRDAALGRVTERLEKRMGDLVRHEAEFAATAVKAALPVEVDLDMPELATLVSIVDDLPFEGATLAQWMERLADSDKQRIKDAVKTGMVRGLSNQDIARMVVGSSVIDGRDGATQLTRSQIDGIVRTATNAYSNQARAALFEINSDVVGHEVYTATLDARTTPRCRSLDGKVYAVGEGPMPPQHFRCRSLRVALVGAQLVGNRPMKATTERLLVAEFAKANGFSARRRENIPRGLRGKFDDYARRRVREIIGTAPAHLTYEQFLRRQDPAFVAEVLGKRKAELFLKGGLTLDRFVTRTGREYTLSELADRERTAFLKAGVEWSGT